MKLFRATAACIARILKTVSWYAQGLRRPSIKMILVNGEPRNPRRNVVYVRKGASGPAFGYLACPCGCGATLHLRFVGERRPRWSISLDRNGRVTLHPSVWRRVDCNSHFVVRAGKIEWC